MKALRGTMKNLPKSLSRAAYFQLPRILKAKCGLTKTSNAQMKALSAFRGTLKNTLKSLRIVKAKFGLTKTSSAQMKALSAILQGSPKCAQSLHFGTTGLSQAAFRLQSGWVVEIRGSEWFINVSLLKVLQTD